MHVGTDAILESHVNRRTIKDFGDQWTRYRDNSGFYGSTDLLADILGPLMPLDEFRGTRIADIGSGTGRIVNMLLDAGAAHVIAIEPSEAFDVLEQNTANRREQVCCIRATGEAVASEQNLDFVTSIGVMHHIVDPLPCLRAAHQALRSGGRCVIWVYGREGNEAYLRLIQPLRWITKRLPHVALSALAWILTLALDAYAIPCRRWRLPLADYVTRVLGKMTRGKRYLVVYDQLNPAYAKYYRGEEAEALLTAAGFADVEKYHRWGYSWTVIGRRSDQPAR